MEDTLNITADSSNSETQTTKANNNNSVTKVFIELGKVMSRVGITGFIVLFSAVLIIFWATPAQKKELVDVWFLFKGEKVFSNIAIFALVLLFVIQQYHYVQNEKLLKKRIDELANEKTLLQKLLLDKKLSSTRKKGK